MELASPKVFLRDFSQNLTNKLNSKRYLFPSWQIKITLADTLDRRLINSSCLFRLLFVFKHHYFEMIY